MHHSVMPGKLRGSQLAPEISFRYTRGKKKQEKGKMVKRMRKKRREKRLGEAII